MLSRLLYLVLVLFPGFCSEFLFAQSPSVTLEELMDSTDPQMSDRAERLHALLQRNEWSYVGDDGKQRTFSGRYLSTDSQRGKAWVSFSSRVRIELSRLIPEDQRAIEEIKRYQSLTDRDAREYRRQLAQQEEFNRREEAAQMRAIQEEEIRRDPPVPVADVLVDATAIVVVDGAHRAVVVNRGEMLTVLSVEGDRVQVVLGNKEATLPLGAVSIRQVRSSEIVGKRQPALQESRKIPMTTDGIDEFPRPATRSSWPKRLDVDFDYIDNGRVVQIVLNDVFAGGVGERMGLRPGDTIVLVNDLELQRKDQFRQAILSDVPPTFLVSDANGRRRIVRYAGDAPVVALLSGVNGQANSKGEFVVSFISKADELTTHLGLRRGDIILAVNHQPIRSAEDLRRSVENAVNGLEFVLLRAGAIDPVRLRVR